MYAVHCLIFFVCAALTLQAQAVEPSLATEARVSKLPGRYEIVAGERNGEPIPADRLHGISVRIANNAITTLDKGKKEIYVATYELDTNKKPWHVRMSAVVTPVPDAQGTTAKGLMEADGETVKLIYALPHGDQPTEFKTKHNQQMFTLKQIERLPDESTSKAK